MLQYLQRKGNVPFNFPVANVKRKADITVNISCYER